MHTSSVYDNILNFNIIIQAWAVCKVHLNRKSSTEISPLSKSRIQNELSLCAHSSFSDTVGWVSVAGKQGSREASHFERPSFALDSVTSSPLTPLLTNDECVRAPRREERVVGVRG